MPDGNSTTKKDGIKNEFLIFKIETNPKVSNAYKFLGLADSLDLAKKLVDELPSNETGRLVILEKKIYYERKPAIFLSELEENIIVEPSKS